MTDSSHLKADLKGARWALDYLLFEDGQSKHLSVHGAMCLDLIRRYIEDQEAAVSDTDIAPKAEGSSAVHVWPAPTAIPHPDETR